MIVRVGLLVRGKIGSLLDDQAARIEKPASLPRLRLVHPFRDHRFDHQIGDARRRFAGTLEQQCLLAERAAGDPQRGQHSRQHDRRGPLNVVVERRDPIAIFPQQPERVVGRKVFELNHYTGEQLAGSDHELFDQGVIFLAANARLMQTDIERIVEQLGIVGADVEKHRQAGVSRHART